MPNHDIIDNRREKLVDHILTILPQAERARFVVGYLFLSGLSALGRSLDSMKELRLLIGNTSNRETIELLAEGHHRLELVNERLEKNRYPGRIDNRRRTEETALNLRETIEVMDQTDDAEDLVRVLLRMIEDQRLKVKVYTRGRLHAKAYIFDWSQPNPGNRGIAVVGSSNLSLAGIQDNTELNILVHDNASPMHPESGNHAALVEWFEELWNESQDFESYLMEELRESWAVHLAIPYDIYMKTLYTLVADRLEGGEDRDILWDDEITRDLADFQKVAVRQAIQMIRDHGGCFVADVVGLGKSFIGAGIVKHFERTMHARPLIICPKTLEEMWIRYNEVYHLNANILPMSMLQEDPDRGVNLFDDVRYRDRDLVLIDESHNFRHHTSQRYEVLQGFLSTGRQVCLLTATPRNSRALDLYNQMKLFHQEDRTALPVDPPDLREYFKLIERGERRLQDVLTHVLIRRTRRHVLRWYGFAADTGKPLRELSDDAVRPYLDGRKKAYVMVGGRHQFFPKRELESLRYSIDAVYKGIYQEIRGYLGRPRGEGGEPKPGVHLTYARYGLWNYVYKEKQRVTPYVELHRAGINLRGLIRTSLFKRFESSIHAFRESLRRMIRTHDMFLRAIESGFIPAGEEAETLLGKAGQLDEQELMDAIGKVSGSYQIEDFDAPKLKEHIEADITLLKKILALVEPITPELDDKLQTFLRRLEAPPIRDNKCLIFTQYADTAEYIYKNLNPKNQHRDIEVIFGTDKSKARTAWRFAPIANRDFSEHPPTDEIRLLVTTDVMAEGLNLQDGNIVLNYDLHWNPVRLIQRFGRVDRIGTEFDTIYGLNFLPETALERHLGIQEVLARRIQEIHETIGEDAAILDRTEQLNEDAMYAIYERGDAGGVDAEDEEFMDVNEAEEFFRTLAKDNPAEYDRIRNLRDGIRASREKSDGNIYVMCQAGRYTQLFLVTDDGQPISRDLPRVLEAVTATPDTPGMDQLPKGYNERVMRIRDLFAEEVKHLESQRDYTIRLRPAQRYVLRELRVLFSQSDDEDRKYQINELEKAFHMSPTGAVGKELNSLRRNGVTGENLLKTLITIYHQHRLKERLEQPLSSKDKAEIPRIICSEAL